MPTPYLRIFNIMIISLILHFIKGIFEFYTVIFKSFKSFFKKHLKLYNIYGMILKDVEKIQADIAQ